MVRIVKIFKNKVEPRENVKLPHVAPATNSCISLPCLGSPPIEGYIIGTVLSSLQSLLVPGYNLDSRECLFQAGLCERAILGLLKDVYLGADLEGRAQFDVHGTHKMLFLK